MKEIKIKIYGWSDLKKWFWDRFCFPRRKQVVEWIDYHNDNLGRKTADILLKYQGQNLEKDNYSALQLAMDDWWKECKSITEDTTRLIMMK